MLRDGRSDQGRARSAGRFAVLSSVQARADDAEKRGRGCSSECSVEQLQLPACSDATGRYAVMGTSKECAARGRFDGPHRHFLGHNLPSGNSISKRPVERLCGRSVGSITSFEHQDLLRSSKLCRADALAIDSGTLGKVLRSPTACNHIDMMRAPSVSLSTAANATRPSSSGGAVPWRARNEGVRPRALRPAACAHTRSWRCRPRFFLFLYSTLQHARFGSTHAPGPL